VARSSRGCKEPVVLLVAPAGERLVALAQCIQSSKPTRLKVLGAVVQPSTDRSMFLLWGV
jgi:hypothetical protein